MSRIFALAASALSMIVALTRPGAAEPQDTDMPGVTAEVAFSRQYDGVLHLGVMLHNSGAHETSAAKALSYGEVVVIDAKANKKYFPLKDANGRYLAGPISDWNGGGRLFAKLPPQSDLLVWVLFDAIPGGGSVTVKGPLFSSFEKVALTDGPPAPGRDVASSAPPSRASLLSATREDRQLNIRLKVVNPGAKRAEGHFVSYQDVYALDPRGKRSYPLLKDADGLYVAQPISDKNNGGRWFPKDVPPGGQAVLALSFQAPPDNVRVVDVILPNFEPLEAVAISGEGGASASGLAVAGASQDLNRAIKELDAAVTPQEIKVNLSADLLFDFDKADVKPAAEPELAKVETILKAYPNAKIAIDGHTDGKGGDAYNQALSERRAAAVSQWLVGHGGAASANIRARGWGKTKPVAPNANADGSDNPEGRAKNRRVEITVAKS